MWEDRWSHFWWFIVVLIIVGLILLGLLKWQGVI